MAYHVAPRLPVAIEQFCSRLDAAEQRITQREGRFTSGGSIVGETAERRIGFIGIKKRLSGLCHRCLFANQIVIESDQCFCDLGQELFRVVAGEVHQSLEGSGGKLGCLLDMPVLGNKALVFALGQVTVLPELGCDALHANSVRYKWCDDRAGRSNPQ